jgi:chemotaxis protein CheD
MENSIKVGMADYKISEHPGVLTTLGLGSCVGIALYDTSSKIVGLAHIMLPSSINARDKMNVAKFADTAIDSLIRDMEKLGAKKEKLVAKLAGGAQMFAFHGRDDIMRVGLRNIQASKEKLQELGIPIIAEDTGGNYGRTIEFYSDDGRLLVKTIGYGNRQI